jgi:hypothetical protein
MRPSRIVGAVLGALALVCACSSESTNDRSDEQKGTGGSEGIFEEDPGIGGSGFVEMDSGVGRNGCPAVADDEGCVGEVYFGETIPVDIYVMFDQSGSMLNVEEGGITRMDAVRQAMGDFLNDPGSAGLSVGIGYFGQQPIGQTTCDPATYETPDVTVGELPGQAQAIIDSLAGREPTGETPSGGAIRGACTYAQQWKRDHATREVVILLVTDGEPKAPVTCGDEGGGPCCPTLTDAVEAAGDCLGGEPGLKTFVLGVGPFLDNLGQIAAAGGTDSAYLVSGGDVSKQVLDALNAIRAAAQIPCELNIPPAPEGEKIDITRINLMRTSSTCETETLFYRTAPDCDGQGSGWYFDDPASPKKVLLCEKTCRDVSLPGEQLNFSVGCGRIDLR